MTIGDALAEMVARLTAAGLDDPQLLAEMLIEDATGIARLELPFHVDDDVADAEGLLAWCDRVAAGEPIQYVVGWCSFRGHRIKTDARALIPRPETEELVSRVLVAGGERVADVGTGTGCIAIALCLEDPRATVLAIDAEPKALSLAAENVAAHGLESRIELRQGDGLDGVRAESLDVVVSNPPYVTEEEMAGLSATVREYEPSSALVSGADGLDLIRRLAPAAMRVLRPGGRLFLEIGETQGDAVRELMMEAGFQEVMVHPDLAGRDRMVEGRKM